MNLLLFSLAEFWPFSAELVAAVGAKRVVEIGVGDGSHGRLLRELGIDVCSIDPVSPATIQGHSPDRLAEAAVADIYFVDGDHNYETVAAELPEIDRLTSSAAIIVLHDIGWPSGRRDLAYDLTRVSDPQNYSSTLGCVPGVNELVPDGFHSNGPLAVKRFEGGSRNGIMTAVEDFRAGHECYSWHSIAAIFGLGVLCPPNHTAAIAAVMARFDSPLLNVLEGNRIDLYLKVLEMQRSLTHERNRNRRLERTPSQDR